MHKIKLLNSNISNSSKSIIYNQSFSIIYIESKTQNRSSMAQFQMKQELDKHFMIDSPPFNLQPIQRPQAVQHPTTNNQQNPYAVKQQEIFIIQDVQTPATHPQPPHQANINPYYQTNPVQNGYPQQISITSNQNQQIQSRKRMPKRQSLPVRYYQGDTYIYPYYYDSSGCYYCCWFNGNCCPCQNLHQCCCSPICCDPFPCCNGCTGFHCGCLDFMPCCQVLQCVQNNNCECCQFLPCCSACQFCSNACDGACISALPCCNGCQCGQICQIIPCCNGCQFDHICGCLPCCNNDVCNICECLQGCELCNCIEGGDCGNLDCNGCDCGNLDCNGCDCNCDCAGCDCDGLGDCCNLLECLCACLSAC